MVDDAGRQGRQSKEGWILPERFIIWSCISSQLSEKDDFSRSRWSTTSLISPGESFSMIYGKARLLFENLRQAFNEGLPHRLLLKHQAVAKVKAVSPICQGRPQNQEI